MKSLNMIITESGKKIMYSTGLEFDNNGVIENFKYNKNHANGLMFMEPKTDSLSIVSYNKVNELLNMIDIEDVDAIKKLKIGESCTSYVDNMTQMVFIKLW